MDLDDDELKATKKIKNNTIKNEILKLINELKNEYNTAITNIIKNDYKMEENGAVAQTVDYIIGKLETILKEN